MNLIKSVIENREWIFSGIGVSVLGLVIYAIRHWLFPGKTQAQTTSTASLAQPEPPHSKKIVHISPQEIVERLSSVPDLQQDDVFKSYRGMHVQWIGTLLNASKSNQFNSKTDIAHIQLGYPSTEEVFHKAIIYGDIDLNTHPELNVAHKRTTIRITGDIDSFHMQDGISLRECEIEFVEENEEKTT